MRNELLTWGPRVRRWILLGMVAGVPILFLRTGVDPFNVPKLAFLLVGVVTVAAVRAAELVQGATFRAARVVLMPGGALVLALVVAWAFSPYRGWAMLGQFGRFQGLLPYILVVVLSLLVYDAFVDDGRPVLWAVVVSAGVVSAYALIQTIGADPFTWSAFGAPTRAISTLGNPNFTGGFLAIALPLCLGLAAADTSRRRIALRLGVLIAAGWIAARSEGAWVGGAAGCAVFAGIYLAARNDWWCIAGYGTAGLLAAGILIAGLLGASRNIPLIPHTLELRGGWWLSAAEMGADHLLVGRGPNTYAVEGVQYRSGRDAEELGFNFTDDPHSFPLSLLAGAGILGVLAYLTIVGSVIHRINGTAPTALVVAAVAGALVAYLVQGLASIDELSLRVGFWALLATAFVGAPSPSSRRAQARDRSPTKKKARVTRAPLRHAWALPLLALAPLGAIVAAGILLAADQKVQYARAVVNEEPARGADLFIDGMELRAEPYYRYLGGLEVGNAAVDEDGGNEELLADAEALFAYLESFPDVRGLVGYGRILREWTESTGDDRNDEALALLRRAMRLDPLNPMIRVEIADVLVAMSDFDAAREVLGPAVELVGTDSHPEVWGALALVHARTGATAAAQEAIAIARALDPADTRAAAAAELLDTRN